MPPASGRCDQQRPDASCFWQRAPLLLPLGTLPPPAATQHPSCSCLAPPRATCFCPAATRLPLRKTCPVLPRTILSYLPLSCPASHHPVLPPTVRSCLAMSCPALHHPVLHCTILSCPAQHTPPALFASQAMRLLKHVASQAPKVGYCCLSHGHGSDLM